MIKLRKLNLKQSQAGFTLAEVTIASGVFAVVLIIIVLAIIGFFSVYFKSLASSSVQNTAQSVSNTIEQAVRYTAPSGVFASAVPTPGNLGYFCTGSQEFTYYIGKAEGTSELGANQHALYEAPQSGSCAAAAQTGGVSLLGDHYRLLNPPVTTLNTYKGFAIDIKLAFTSGGANGAGDDLLCSPTTNGCNPNSTQLTSTQLNSGTISDIACRYGSGSQFCKVVELQSVIGAHVF